MAKELHKNPIFKTPGWAFYCAIRILSLGGLVGEKKLLNVAQKVANKTIYIFSNLLVPNARKRVLTISSKAVLFSPSPASFKFTSLALNEASRATMNIKSLRSESILASDTLCCSSWWWFNKSTTKGKSPAPLYLWWSFVICYERRIKTPFRDLNGNTLSANGSTLAKHLELLWCNNIVLLFLYTEIWIRI